MIHHVDKSLYHVETLLYLWSSKGYHPVERPRDPTCPNIVISSRTHHVHLTLPPSNVPSRVHEPFSFTHRRLLTLFMPVGREKDGEGVTGWIREGRWNCQCCIGPPRVKTDHGSSVIISCAGVLSRRQRWVHSLSLPFSLSLFLSLFLSLSLPLSLSLSLSFRLYHIGAVAHTFCSLSSSALSRFCLIVPHQ